MSVTLVTSDSSATPSGRKRTVTIALWLLQVLLALQFAMSGYLKLSGNDVMIDMFTTIGVGQWFRFLVGALELAGALGLLIPRLSGLAASGLAGLLVGAAATNVLILGADPWFPFILLVLSVLVAVGRRQQTMALLSGLSRRMRGQM